MKFMLNISRFFFFFLTSSIVDFFTERVTLDASETLVGLENLMFISTVDLSFLETFTLHTNNINIVLWCSIVCDERNFL